MPADAYYQKHKDEPEFKLRRHRYAKEYETKNADYIKKRRQAYQQRPEVKERHVIEQHMYRDSKQMQLQQQSRDKYKDDEKYREAIKEQSRLFRKTNKDIVKIKDRERKQKLRHEVISHYSDGKCNCACCGEDEFYFLSLDHINGGGHKHRRLLGKDGINFYAWIKKIGYPEGYQILCMNCNWGKRMNPNGEICPHQDRT